MGQHAVLACGANETSNIRIDIRLISGVSQEAIAHGVFAASAVFARYRADPRRRSKGAAPGTSSTSANCCNA